MKQRIALFVSFLFNPLFLAYLFPFLIVYRYTYSGLYALKWLLFSSIFVVGGTTYLFYGRLKGIFSDMDISVREERPKFYRIIFFLALLYLLLSIFFKGYRFPISIFAFGISLATVAYAILNRHVKASGHVGVATAFVIALGFLYGVYFFVSFLWLIPLLAWSRVTLKKHTVREVIAGAGLGMVVTLLTLFLGNILYGRLW